MPVLDPTFGYVGLDLYKYGETYLHTSAYRKLFQFPTEQQSRMDISNFNAERTMTMNVLTKSHFSAYIPPDYLNRSLTFLEPKYVQSIHTALQSIKHGAEVHPVHSNSTAVH
jgi:hypothetical protein